MNHQAEYLEEELRKARAEIEEMRKRLAVPDVSTMARVLSDRAASACCVDPDDNWKIYGQEFIEDVRAMLAAPAPVERVEREPVAYLFPDDAGRTKIVLGKETAELWCPPDETITPLYATPQPAAPAPAPAPVERVEQEPVAEILVDSRGMIVDAVRKPCHLVPGFHKVYTAPQPAPTAAQDVAGLVEALELALEYWRDRQQRYKNRKPRWVADAESALAAHQQREGE